MILLNTSIMSNLVCSYRNVQSVHPDSPYYESEAFGAILAYAAQNPMLCRLREEGTKRSLQVSDVKDIDSAIGILRAILTPAL